MKKTMLSFAMLLICTSALASNLAKTTQSAKQIQLEANKFLNVLRTNKKVAFSCMTAEGNTAFVITQGRNTEDKSGLIVTGAFSYGTNKIWQLSVGNALMLIWGEESNYTAVVSNLDGSDGIQAENATDGYLIVNDEQKLVSLSCELK